MKTKLLSSLVALWLAGCAVPAPVKVVPVPRAVAPVQPTVDALLAYHRSLDGVSQADLTKELTALNSAPAGAATEVRKAIVLGYMRDPARSARARAILAGVLLMDDADALALRPLVEWMISNDTELRRVTQLSNERQAVQLKDAQRRYDQLNDKLEAMKRIESSQPASPIEIAPAK